MINFVQNCICGQKRLLLKYLLFYFYSRGIGFLAENQDIKIDFGDEKDKDKDIPKDVPIWITQSTIEGAENLQSFGADSSGFNAHPGQLTSGGTENVNKDENDEITRLLLTHEKKNSAATTATKGLQNDSDSDKSDDSDLEDISMKPVINDNVEVMSSDDSDMEGIPLVRVGNEEITLTDITKEDIDKMTDEEKHKYSVQYQEYFAHMHD